MADELPPKTGMREYKKMRAKQYFGAHPEASIAEALADLHRLGVNIGERTKIQSHSFICELVDIGKDCFIGHGVMFINDTFAKGEPARGDKSLWKQTRICDNVSIGSNATILPVTVCSNVVIGAGSVVTRDIIAPGVYVGNPARLIKKLSD